MKADESDMMPAPAPDVRGMTEAVTFFLTAPQRETLVKRLRRIARNRSVAIVELLDLDSTVAAEGDAP